MKKYLLLCLIITSQVCFADWWVTEHNSGLYEVNKQLPCYTHTEWYSIPDNALSQYTHNGIVDVIGRDSQGNPTGYFINRR